VRPFASPARLSRARTCVTCRARHSTELTRELFLPECSSTEEFPPEQSSTARWEITGHH
jgi:hypothetical protein